MGTEEYETTPAELKKAIQLADKDKVVYIEDEEKAVVIVELSKEQAKKLRGS